MSGPSCCDRGRRSRRRIVDGFDLVQLGVFVGHDIEHAGHRPGVGEIETVDAALGDRAGHKIGKGRIATGKSDA